MKGVLPRMVGWLIGTTDFGPSLAALLGLVHNIYTFSPYTISLHLSPSPSKLGRQSCRFTVHGLCSILHPLQNLQ
jgi:hypothetical protein